MTKRIFLHLVLIALAILSLASFLWMLAASFMSSGETGTAPKRKITFSLNGEAFP